MSFKYSYKVYKHVALAHFYFKYFDIYFKLLLLLVIFYAFYVLLFLGLFLT